MIATPRGELLDLLGQLSAACPEYRLGQMLLNLAFLAREEGEQDLWNMEDSELIEAARKHLADWDDRHLGTNSASPDEHEPANGSGRFG